MVWGHAPAWKLGALRLLLRPYLYPNATSPTRIHGGSNTAVQHQSSWGKISSSGGTYPWCPPRFRRLWNSLVLVTCALCLLFCFSLFMAFGCQCQFFQRYCMAHGYLCQGLCLLKCWRLRLKFHCHANMLTTFHPFPSFSPLLPVSLIELFLFSAASHTPRCSQNLKFSPDLSLPKHIQNLCCSNKKLYCKAFYLL